MFLILLVFELFYGMTDSHETEVGKMSQLHEWAQGDGVRPIASWFSLLLWKCAFGRLSVSVGPFRGSGFSEWFLF